MPVKGPCQRLLSGFFKPLQEIFKGVFVHVTGSGRFPPAFITWMPNWLRENLSRPFPRPKRAYPSGPWVTGLAG